MIDLSDTVEAKSDQLNAEDLITGDRVLVVTNVVKYIEKGVKKYYLNYDGDCGRPFKPCLIMRRLLNALWGENGAEFIGRSISVYHDSDVDFGKQKGIGGVRINGLSNIKGKSKILLTVRRRIKKEFIVNKIEPMEKPNYNQDQLNSELQAMSEAITSGRMTAEQIINQCESIAKLSDEQKHLIRGLGCHNE